MPDKIKNFNYGSFYTNLLMTVQFKPALEFENPKSKRIHTESNFKTVKIIINSSFQKL